MKCDMKYYIKWVIFANNWKTITGTKTEGKTFDTIDIGAILKYFLGV